MQTTLGIGALGPARTSPDYAAVQVANALYGGMFGSRLTLNIREDKGYTYSPFAEVSPHSTVGLIETWAAVRNQVTGATINEIEYELNRLATTSPSEEELAHAQRYLVGTQAVELQGEDALGRSLARLWVLGLAPEELGRESERIGKVTVQDVGRAAPSIPRRPPDYRRGRSQKGHRGATGAFRVGSECGALTRGVRAPHEGAEPRTNDSRPAGECPIPP